MVNFVYNLAKQGLMNGTIDLDADTIRCLLLEAVDAANNKDDDDVAAVLVRAGTTELATYTRQTLGSLVVSVDDPNDRAEFSSANVVFTAVVTQNAIVAYLFYKFVTSDALSTPLIFNDTQTGLPLTPNGSDITITAPAEGWLQSVDA